jgi:hypothetical protein
MLAALVVLLRTLGLLCSGHRAVALENVALRQQLVVSGLVRGTHELSTHGLRSRAHTCGQGSD